MFNEGAQLVREEEQSLINQVILGDPDAIRVFFKNYKKLIYHTIHGFKFIPKSEVDDYFNNFFVRLMEDEWRRLTLWRCDCSLSTYLVTILKNYLKDEGRKNRPETLDIDAANIPDTSTIEDMEHKLYIKDLMAYVDAARGSLSDRDRELINRTFFKNEEPDEISEALNINVNSYYVALHRAQKRLIELIQKEFPFLFGDNENDL